MCATCTSHFNLLIITTLGQEFRLPKQTNHCIYFHTRKHTA